MPGGLDAGFEATPRFRPGILSFNGDGAYVTGRRHKFLQRPAGKITCAIDNLPGITERLYDRGHVYGIQVKREALPPWP